MGAGPLLGEETVALVATWPIRAEAYTAMLAKKGLQAQVVISDFSEYEKELRWTGGPFQRWLRKWSLDFPQKISLKTNRLVFFNITDHCHRDLDLRRLSKEQMILFLWEPPNVLGKMYKPRVTKCFGKVYTCDDDLVDGKKFFKLHYPSLRPMIENVVPFEEKKLCTLVASHISNQSPTSLYGEREKAIAFFEEVGEEGFEFYGRGWEGEHYASYRGFTEDKIQTIKQYRFSICYENTQQMKGYITEKIFDCFAAGNVPIYWGAPNIKSYIPEDCFIDRCAFASMEALYAFLKSMNKEVYDGYLTRIRAFLESEQAKVFSTEHFEQVFYQAVR